MIKLKHILKEAGVFDSPDTYAIGAPKIEPAKMDTSGKGGLGWVEPPYDNMMEKYMEIEDPEKQKEAYDQMLNTYDQLITELNVTGNMLYGKDGIFVKLGAKAAAGEIENTDMDISVKAMQKLLAALTAQAEEIEIVIAYLASSPIMGAATGLKNISGVDMYEGELNKLQKNRKAKGKEFLDNENAKKAVSSKETKEATKVVKGKKESFVTDVTKALETQQSLTTIDPPAKEKNAEYDAMLQKFDSTMDSFISKYSDEDDDEDEASYAMFKKFQQQQKDKKAGAADEGMIKLKPLVEAGGDIDLSKVFMKGVGPGGEPNPDQLTDEPKAEKAIEDALKDLERDVKKSDLEPKTVDEALGLTLAGVALSMPAIISLIGKFVNLLKKIPFLKSLSGDKLITLGDKWHHKITGGFEYIIKKAGVKDSVKAKKFANILHHTIIAILLVAGGVAGYQALSKGNIAGATMKGALNAVKSGELKVFLLKSAAGI